MTGSLLETALTYCARGRPVFPLADRGKVPRTPRGLHDASADPERVAAWWQRWPGANVGLPLRAGELVLDVDPRHGGEEALAELLARHGVELPTTRTARTGGGGRHVWFALPEGFPVSNGAGRLGPGLDVRTFGGYVVVPPSVTGPPAVEHGGAYAWLHAEHGVAAAPAWLLEELAPKRRQAPAFVPRELDGEGSRYGLAALEAEAARLAGTPEGGRNSALNVAAYNVGQLVAGGELDENLARERLLAAALACGLDEREAERTLASGLDAGLAEPRTAPERPAPPKPTRTAAGGAERPAEPPRAAGEGSAPSPEQNAPRIADAEPAPWQAQPWADFRDEAAADELRFLVDGLWPEGALGFVAARPKAGKTWLGLALALAVATGRPLFGDYAVAEPRPVLYVALEGARAGLRARIGALARGLGLDPDGASLERLHVAYRPRPFNLAEPELAGLLVAEAHRLDAALVIVDVLRQATRGLKEAAAEDFARVRDALEPLLAERRAVALLHHFGKWNETQRERLPANA